MEELKQELLGAIISYDYDPNFMELRILGLRSNLWFDPKWKTGVEHAIIIN